jgi:hypothetical protein
VSFGQFQFRRDTSTNWTTNNPTLLSGEMGIETDTNMFKLGDGATAWTSLAYGGIQGPTGTTGVGNAAVQVVAISNQSLSSLPTIDGVALANSARLLLVGQTTTSQNGIWVTAASGSGAWTRPTDFSGSSNQVGTAVDVEAGTTYNASRWVMTGTATVTVNTTPQAWVEIGQGTMPAYTIQGNDTASPASAQDLTIAQVQSMLGTTSLGKMLAAARGYNLN